VSVAVALALLPAPRAIAWAVLLFVPAALAVHVSRAAGGTAATTVAFAYMIIHGQPRFAIVVTDQWTIRGSFLLGIVSFLGTFAAGRANRGSGGRLMALHSDDVVEAATFGTRPCESAGRRGAA
jgi:hypothetical protein